MTRRTRLVLTALSLAAGLTAATALVCRDTARTPAAAPSVELGSRAPYAGVYRLHLEHRSALRLTADAENPLAAELTLDGALTVQPASGRDLWLTLSRPDRVDGTLNDTPLDALPQAFEAAAGVPVLARYDAEGVLTGLSFPPGVGESTQGVFQQLAAVLQWSDTPGTRVEETPLGRVTAVVTAAGETRLRKRSDYRSARTTLDVPVTLAVSGGDTRWEMAPTGGLRGLTHEETTRGVDPRGRVMVDERLALTLERAGDAGRPSRTVTGLRPVAVGGLATDDASQARSLRDAADGLTGDALVEGLLSFSGDGAPGESRFLFRAAALLLVEPELARRLSGVFDRLPASATARRVVLDLLAQVGTGPAQQTLVQILESEASLQDPDHLQQYQRLALVGAPGPEVVALAEAKFEDEAGQGDLGDAAGYVLGGVAGRLAETGGEAGARQALALGAPLVERLEAATDDVGATTHLLRALGNVGRPEHLTTVRGYVDAEAPPVRQAAAAALRRIDAPEARELLGDLASDPVTEVSCEALGALSGRRLDADDYTRLGRVAREVDRHPLRIDVLLNLLTEHVDEAPARALLEVIARRADIEGHLVARAEALLAARG